MKRPAVDSPLIYRPPTRPISLRMPLTPPIRSLATLSPYPNPPPCIPLATVSQSHSSAVGKGPASSPSLPSLCFGPSVHASGRQGQGPARFLVPLVNRGPVARRASSVGTAHSVHSPAPGGGRNERSEERAVILPSHHGPSPSLPAEPGQGSDRLSLISSVPSLRRVTSFPHSSLSSVRRSYPPSVLRTRRVKWRM